jgi:aconitase A
MVITCAIFYGAYANIHEKNFKNAQLLAFAINNVQTKLRLQQEEIDQLKNQLKEMEESPYTGSVEVPPPPPQP